MLRSYTDAPAVLPRGVRMVPPARPGSLMRTAAYVCARRRHGGRMRSARPTGSQDGSAPPPPSCADRRRHCATSGPPVPTPARPRRGPCPRSQPVPRLPQAGAAVRRDGPEPGHDPDGALGRQGHLTPDATSARCCQCRSRPRCGSHRLRARLGAPPYPAATSGARRELGQDRGTPRTEGAWQSQTD